MVKNKLIKVGIIGCGAIGSRLAKEIDRNLSASLKLVAICDIDTQKAIKFCANLRRKPKICSQNKLIKSCNLIIEAASAKISFNIANKAISAGKDVLIMSVGGLLGKDNLFKKADKRSAYIYIPSGAIAGVDAVKSASIAGIKKLTLTTYKGPKSLVGAPYLERKEIDLKRIKKEKVIFYDSVKEAVKGFPKNINVSAILRLASGFSKLKVKIVLCPKLKRNVHKIEVEGNFGKVTTISENVPCPDNKKTSYLAVLSAISVLRQISDTVKIGS